MSKMSMMEKKLRGEYNDSTDRREPSMPGAAGMMMKKPMKKKAGKKK